MILFLLQINPHKCIAIDKACSTIKNSFTTLEEIFDCIGILLAKLKPLKADQKIYGEYFNHPPLNILPMGLINQH